MDMRKWNLWVITFLVMALPSCKSSLKETEYQKIRHANRTHKHIQRTSSDHLIDFSSSEVASRPAYPWEPITQKHFPYITKEFFRCKGSRENPSFLINKERVFDCGGFERHSLPLKEDREFVYPILIDLLNFLQTKLNARVIVTCGHRCPKHNRYSDPSDYNKTSKHMIGAEVDFYVDGYEDEPSKVVDALMSYYQQKEYEDRSNYQKFVRYEKKDVNVSTPPWYNQEVFIKLYHSNEGRDLDNPHSYPYVSVQVRYDPEQKSRVSYTWQDAFYSYLRY